MKKGLVIVRGAGDIATGTIAKLFASGFPVVALECERPSAIRRKVAFSEAVYAGNITIEGMTARLVKEAEIEATLEAGEIPVLVDPACEILTKFKPHVLVDGILAKKNLGTNREMADITIGLGPGFTAGVDVDAVIETKRGHQLGRIYYTGEAIKNTGIPGMVGGYAKERVIYSPSAGLVCGKKQICDIVEKGEIIAYVDDVPVYATISGVLRGILPDGFKVTEGYKMADIDPRIEEQRNCTTISEKARCIAGGVLEAMLCLDNR